MQQRAMGCNRTLCCCCKDSGVWVHGEHAPLGDLLDALIAIHLDRNVNMCVKVLLQSVQQFFLKTCFYCVFTVADAFSTSATIMLGSLKPYIQKQ